MTKILIENGRVINPATSFDAVATIAIENRKVIGIYQNADQPAGFDHAKKIDASDCIVLPGLVDLAVRLREPGQEHEGMLESELQAAVVGV
jgi:dihydroorotase